VRFLLKTAVAAVILLAVLFHGTTSTTSGTTLAQVRKAFREAENAHISTVDPITGQPTLDLWISRPLNIVLAVTERETVLYDLGARKEYVGQTVGGAAYIVELTDRDYAYARQTMTTGLGFSPDKIPPDARWTRADSDASQGNETYELSYSEQSTSGVIALRKWTLLIDPTTKRPQEVRTFRRLPAESEWHPLETTTVQYPTAGEMNKVIGEQGLGTGRESY
jgi:hypothetical protein